MHQPRHVVKPEHYAIAAALLASGAWTLDAATGTITSAWTGRPLKPAIRRGGYRVVSVKVPGVGWRQITLSRIVWESVHGPIPPGLQVNHKDCDKGSNGIDNLELTTCQENIDHAVAHGLRGPVLRGQDCGPARLTNAEVLEIRELLATSGLSQAAIARRFGVAQATVWRIKVGRNWSHLQEVS